MAREFTDKQKKAWKEQMQEREDQAKEQIHDLARSFRDTPEQIQEFLTFGAKFYQYSARNTMLIYKQNRGATYVQSFKNWKDMGHPVKRGEHGINILVPVQCTLIKDDGAYIPLREATKEQKELFKAGKLESATVLRFKMGTVFDISQTTFPKEKYPEIYAKGYSSETHEILYHALTRYAKEKLGAETRIEDLKSIALNGSYHPIRNEITINELLEGTNRFSTMTHELGHAILHHSPENRLKLPSQIEYEADCMSILLHTHLGLEIPDGRTRHLSTHFQSFIKHKEEMFLQENPEISSEECAVQVEEVITMSFHDVFQEYQKTVEELQPYLDEALEKQQEEQLEEECMKSCMARTRDRSPEHVAEMEKGR